MSSLLYWLIFCFLASLLIVFTSCIIFNVILDYCLTGHDDPTKTPQLTTVETDEISRLNKYHFDKHDVEDLTRIQGDFKTVIPQVTCKNEVGNSSVERLLNHNRLSDINEEESLKHSFEDLDSEYSIITEENELDHIKEKRGISKSVDDLEFCDPRGIDVLKEIDRIKEEARKVEGQLAYFVGGTNDVKFYEINENLLKLMIALCDVTCETDDLRKKKKETLEYIEGCQKELKEKAQSL